MEEYEEFEEFKTKSVKEWESLKNLTLTKYLICALTGEHYLESLNDCDSNTNVYKKYKIFKCMLGGKEGKFYQSKKKKVISKWKRRE